MDHKNLVNKSKSSNTAIATNTNDGPKLCPTNYKKCWSSARFGNVRSRKRGMYVEKKPTNTEFGSTAQGPSDVPKAPKRPRRGDKTFLNRCLSILSQETKETQFPDGENTAAPKQKKPRKPTAETVDKCIQDLDAIYSANASPVRRSNESNAPRRPNRRTTPPPPPKQQNKRFRSKALKGNFNDNKLLILQPNKPPRSPSISSHWSASKTVVPGRLKVDGSERVEQPAPPPKEAKVEEKEQDCPNPVDVTESKKLKKVLRIKDSDSKEFVNKNEAVENNNYTVENDNAKYPVKTDTKENITSILRTENSNLNNRASEHDDVKSNNTTESKKKLKKQLRIEEPKTLVGDYNAKNKSLYNLFVDLLETTFNVYNVDAEYIYPTSPTFEIEEHIAEKLKTKESQQEQKTISKTDYINMQSVVQQDYPPVTKKREKMYFNDDDGVNVTNKVSVYQAKPNCCSWNPPAVSQRKSRRTNFRLPQRNSYMRSDDVVEYRPNLTSQSLRYAQQLKIEAAAKQNSFMRRNNFGYKRYGNKKQSLLDILKEELQLEADYFEEPESFHQALAFIAKDKKRARRALRYGAALESAGIDRKSKDAGRSDCFKRRKVISSSTKSPKIYKARKVDFTKSMRTSELPRDLSVTVFSEPRDGKKTDGYRSDYPSYHSIEVKAYDYEPNQYIHRVDSVDKYQYTRPSNSGVSLQSDTIIGSKDYMDCLNKCGKSLSRNSRESLADDSTTISQLLLRDIYTLY